MTPPRKKGDLARLARPATIPSFGGMPERPNGRAWRARRRGNPPRRFKSFCLRQSQEMPTSPSGYACVVKSRLPSWQWGLGFFLVLAVLFAPAREEDAASPARPADESVGARILAPTVREGITATSPKLSARELPGSNQRSLLGSIPPSLPPVAALLLLASLAWLARQESRAVLRVITLRTRVPRAPPRLLVG
jgi:hypothetical protein